MSFFSFNLEVKQYNDDSATSSNFMTDLNTISKLDDYEDEDIFEVVVKLEKSFGLNFDRYAFYHIKTFGDLCDVFEKHINYEHRDDCTKQQAFYRVREAIAFTQQISRDKIKPDTKLDALFPNRDRIVKAKEFKKAVGTDIKILTYPRWLASTFVFAFLVSLAAFIFDWKIALGGTLFFLAAMKIAGKLGKTFEFQTVGELTKKLSREHYINARRTKGTFNKREILQTIIDTFSKDLAVEKANLTRETTFSWTISTATDTGVIQNKQRN